MTVEPQVSTSEEEGNGPRDDEDDERDAISIIVWCPPVVALGICVSDHFDVVMSSNSLQQTVRSKLGMVKQRGGLTKYMCQCEVLRAAEGMWTLLYRWKEQGSG